MKKVLCFIIAAILFCSALAGCAEKDPKDTEWAKNLNTVKVEKVSASMNDIPFDEKLIRFISGKTDGSYMLSPLSFRYALGLLIAGADGETKTELLNALGVKSVDEWEAYCATFNGFVNHFDEELQKEKDDFERDKEKGYVVPNAEAPFRALRVANSIWKRNDIEADFKPDYRERIAKNYAAEYSEFTRSNAVKLINDWADRKTEGMIPKLLPDDYDTENLAVVLMNALYFKDSWISSFNKSLTADGDFTTAKGDKVTKTFMTQTDDFYYYADSETELVILPMAGDISMAFVLGSTEGISGKVSKAAKHSVKVTVPKIDLESTFNNGEFVDFLRSLGVEKAFDDRYADFSAMIDHDIYVDDIIQKTKIKLDEDGVEAAAVTAIMTKDTAMPIEPEQPFVFTADKPFSFYIYTTCNDVTALMFSGEIVD